MPSVLPALIGGARLLVLHGPLGTPYAIDLESRFAESTLGTVQMADLRQFAHLRRPGGLSPGSGRAYFLLASLTTSSMSHTAFRARPSTCFLTSLSCCSLLPIAFPAVCCSLPAASLSVRKIQEESGLHGLATGDVH